jgi:hypothetical protein
MWYALRNCQSIHAKALKDPDQIKGVVAGLSLQSVDLATQQGNNAEKEVAAATEASKFFLQQWIDQKEARKAALPSMTNQWLYALQEIYSTDSASGSNCTVDGAAEVMGTFMKNARYVKDFSSKTGRISDRPPSYWGKFEGICKVDGHWYYAQFEYSYSSSQDCTASVRSKHAKVDAQYLEMAKHAAPEGHNPCHEDWFECQAKREDGSGRRLLFI